MFGYVRVAKPELKIYEYELYRSLYCGSCEMLGKHSGVLRFALSYDMAFLLALELSLNDMNYEIKHRRCPFNPFKKVMLVVPEKKTLTSDIILLLTKYKLLDTAEDSKIFKMPAKFMAKFVENVSNFDEDDEKFSKLSNLKEVCIISMKEQSELEKLQENSIDRACEPTAKLMKKIFSMLCEEKNNIALERIAYLMGRYIYICDALDDLFDDEKKKQYNVLLMQGLSPKDTIDLGKASIMSSISEMQLALGLVDLSGDFAPIVENVIRRGLFLTLEQIAEKQYKKYEIEIDNKKCV